MTTKRRTPHDTSIGSTDDAIADRIAALLEQDGAAVSSVMCSLFGKMPKWVPVPNVDRARRIVDKLLKDRFPADTISQRVAEAESGELTFPGIVTDAPAFAQAVYELAHIRYAISLGPSMGLRTLAGDRAELGQRFSEGRKPGTGSPIRKAIAKLLSKRSNSSNDELWAAIKARPPRGWQVYETSRLGNYLEGPKNKTMQYRRFCNVCGEERKKMRVKNTG